MMTNCNNIPDNTHGFRAPSIALGFHTELLLFGIRETIFLDLAQEPHSIVLGSTGSGKTYALLSILHALSWRKEIWLFIADFKGIDFTELQGCPRYYQYMRVSQALSTVYAQLQRRMKQARTKQKPMRPIVLVIDEWAAYLSCLEKSEAEQRKKQLSTILMLGRGVRIYCILSLQRGDAAYFERARDNIGHVLMLGSGLSKESLRMWCDSDEMSKIMPQNLGRGKGYLKTGTALVPVTIPKIRDREKVFSDIRESLSRRD